MRQAGWYMIRTRKGWEKCFYSDGWNCSLPVIEVAEPDKRLDQIDLMLQITALQSSLKEKEKEKEKECEDLTQDAAKMYLEMKSENYNQSKQIEELKAENENIKDGLGTAIKLLYDCLLTHEADELSQLLNK